jgi:hypothetical protein
MDWKAPFGTLGSKSMTPLKSPGNPKFDRYRYCRVNGRFRATIHRLAIDAADPCRPARPIRNDRFKIGPIGEWRNTTVTMVEIGFHLPPLRLGGSFNAIRPLNPRSFGRGAE